MNNDKTTYPASPDLDQAAKEFVSRYGFIPADTRSGSGGNDRLARAFKAGAAWADQMTHFPVTAKRMEDIGRCRDQAVGDTSAHSDPYLLGYANGLILAHAILHGIEPNYINSPTPALDAVEAASRRKSERLVPRMYDETEVWPAPGVYSPDQVKRDPYRPGEAIPIEEWRRTVGKSDPLDVLKMEDMAVGVDHARPDGDETVRWAMVDTLEDLNRQLQRAEGLARFWRRMYLVKKKAAEDMGRLIDEQLEQE